MELEIIEETKDKIKVVVKGEGHTFCNLLRKELWNDSHVKVAGYNIKHSLVGDPILIVETDGEEKPRQALKKAVARLKKTIDEFKTKIKV